VNAALVQAHHARTALARARLEVDPACDLAMTPAATLLPQGLIRRLAAIADDKHRGARRRGRYPLRARP
jgi:hypothetical protein